MRAPAAAQDTSVRYFRQGMAGMPTYTGAAGHLQAVMRAALVTGGTAMNITGIVIAGGVATISFASTPDAFYVASVARLAGVATSSMNGDHRVTEVASTYIKVPVTISDATLPAGGTLKLAPLDYTEPFTSGQVSVFKSGDPASLGSYLRLDDSTDDNAKVKMYESMTDVNTGTGESQSGTAYWGKSYNPAANTNYLLVGDSRAVYFCSNMYHPYRGQGYDIGGWGELNSYRSGYAYDSFLLAKYNPGYNQEGNPFFHNGSGYRILARNEDGIGAAINGYTRPVTGSYNACSGADDHMGTYPSRVDSILRLSRIMMIMPNVGAGPRGELPGLLHAPHNGMKPSVFPANSIIEGNGAFAGRKLICAPCASSTMSAYDNGIGFFDITNAWR